MGNTMGARKYWHGWYDVQGRLLSGFDPSTSPTLLVDIGGGKGHDLVAFDNAFGKGDQFYNGQLLLQDQPEVLADVAKDQLSFKIRKMPHDFLEDQPVKGTHRGG
jgi:hypothetical protein